jgi:hypothetical protein
MDVGKRVLKGFVGIEEPIPTVTADTEKLIKQAKELQTEEERLKSSFPAATKMMEANDGTRCKDKEECPENGDESKIGNMLVEKEEHVTSGGGKFVGDSIGSITPSSKHQSTQSEGTEKRENEKS